MYLLLVMSYFISESGFHHLLFTRWMLFPYLKILCLLISDS